MTRGDARLLTSDSTLSTFLNYKKKNELGGVPLMLSLFRRLARDVDGASAVEYTLIVSLIAVAAIASMRSVGSKVSNILGNVGNSLT
jgi:pilus assembly protein Flp/PilA